MTDTNQINLSKVRKIVKENKARGKKQETRRKTELPKKQSKQERKQVVLEPRTEVDGGKRFVKYQHYKESLLTSHLGDSGITRRPASCSKHGVTPTRAIASHINMHFISIF